MGVLQDIKSRQVKASPIYWVVEIVEHESSKVLDQVKKHLMKQVDEVGVNPMAFGLPE